MLYNIQYTYLLPIATLPKQSSFTNRGKPSLLLSMEDGDISADSSRDDNDLSYSEDGVFDSSYDEEEEEEAEEDFRRSALRNYSHLAARVLASRLHHFINNNNSYIYGISA